MTPNYENVVAAAQAAVAAEARHAAAQTALGAAESEADVIRRRILDLDGQRGSVRVRANWPVWPAKAPLVGSGTNGVGGLGWSACAAAPRR